MSNSNGVEVLCPAVYLANSAAEALELVAAEVTQASNEAYNAYGDGNSSSSADIDIIDYFSDLDEED